jgi:hypothetical protein
VLFFAALLPGWWLALRGKPGAYTWAVLTSLVVGSLITFRSATTNQVILYLPLFFFFYRLMPSDPAHPTTDQSSPASRHSSLVTRHLIITAILLGLLILMWATFAATIDGNWEHVMMHGLLPALLLALYALDFRGLWRAAQTLEQAGAA